MLEEFDKLIAEANEWRRFHVMHDNKVEAAAVAIRITALQDGRRIVAVYLSSKVQPTVPGAPE